MSLQEQHVRSIWYVKQVIFWISMTSETFRQGQWLYDVIDKIW